jgi:hypothetical protein
MRNQGQQILKIGIRKLKRAQCVSHPTIKRILKGKREQYH